MTSYLERFNYQLHGPENGPKCVFLHGLMGYGSNWRKIVSGLESNARILTFDQRGHGRSWKPESGYASTDYADDLYFIAEELGWDKFTLVGHSLGGRNALCFAHKYPQKLNKLVIVDIGPDANIGGIEYYKKLLDSVPTPFLTKQEAKGFFLNEWPKLEIIREIIHENVLTLGQYLYSNIEEKNDGTADWRFSREGILSSVIQGRAKDVWHELRSLTMPTLVIRGGRSKDLSHEVFQRMIAANPRVQGIEINNAGHWVHADAPIEFLRIIKDFAEL